MILVIACLSIGSPRLCLYRITTVSTGSRYRWTTRYFNKMKKERVFEYFVVQTFFQHIVRISYFCYLFLRPETGKINTALHFLSVSRSIWTLVCCQSYSGIPARVCVLLITKSLFEQYCRFDDILASSPRKLVTFIIRKWQKVSQFFDLFNFENKISVFE